MKLNIFSPKGDKPDNKLLDSLDDMTYLMHNKQHISQLAEKKYNLKFKRAGSDQDKNKNNETKRTSNFKGNTTGGVIPFTNPITYISKDKKLISKPSVDKISKFNKEGVYSNVSNNSKIIFLN